MEDLIGGCACGNRAFPNTVRIRTFGTLSTGNGGVALISLSALFDRLKLDSVLGVAFRSISIGTITFLRLHSKTEDSQSNENNMIRQKERGIILGSLRLVFGIEIENVDINDPGVMWASKW